MFPRCCENQTTRRELAMTLAVSVVKNSVWIMLALLLALRRGEGDFELFGRYADAMLDDKEFFIRKAIGWVLRDTARKRPGLVFDWLLSRARRKKAACCWQSLRAQKTARRAPG